MNRVMNKSTLLVLISVLCAGTLLAADDFVSIKTIVESGESLHMRSVAMQGTITLLDTGLPTHWWDGSNCGQNDSYTFLLDDSTGVIEVIVRGICGSPKAVVQVHNGEHVSVRGQVYAHRNADSIGAVTVRVMAHHITKT